MTTNNANDFQSSNSDIIPCPQCNGLGVYPNGNSCRCCNTTGIIPLINTPSHKYWAPLAPHSFQASVLDYRVCGTFKNHPIHSGTDYAELQRPLIAA